MLGDSPIALIIIGAGWHGKELYSYILDLQAQGAKISFYGFIDEYKPPGPWGPTQVLGDFQALAALARKRPDIRFHYITATGDNRIRQQFVRKVEGLGLENVVPWTLRHPDTQVGLDVAIGEGTCVAPGVIITTHVRVGRHCILNVKVSVSHDCEIGDFVNLNPGVTVCGNVRIGEGCYIGAGATIINKVTIGEWTTIGAGAVVIDDIPSRVTAVGVPARVIKETK